MYYNIVFYDGLLKIDKSYYNHYEHITDIKIIVIKL